MRQWLCWVLLSCTISMLCSCGSSKRSVMASASTPAARNSSGKGFSPKLGIDVSPIENKKLVATLEAWMDTPYRYGGNSKDGTDCSGLISQVFPAVYGMQVPRTSQTLFDAAQPIAERELREGDLVFFRINTKQVGHAGIFLCNGNFAHATTQRGVTVSNLSDAYWNKYFVGAGRLKKQEAKSKP